MKTNSFDGAGYVYILTNPSMPGIVKIGFTSRSVEYRMDTLYSTGVPTPFECVEAYRTYNFRAVESEIHRRLSSRRVNPNREFFNVSPSEAVEAVESLFSVRSTSVKKSPPLLNECDPNKKEHLEELEDVFGTNCNDSWESCCLFGIVVLLILWAVLFVDLP